MAHKAAYPRPHQGCDANGVVAPFRPRALNDNGTVQRRVREVYCPPALTGDLVDRTFRRLFWGAAHLVLVAPSPAEGGR
ncbi:MAG: hypothetical protein YHS30scaffold392_43 [Phage 64_12]|nr:MAG: hypothetical protein YHS30scaffold392_43 [Phage 64_12]